MHFHIFLTDLSTRNEFQVWNVWGSMYSCLCSINAAYLWANIWLSVWRKPCSSSITRHYCYFLLFKAKKPNKNTSCALDIGSSHTLRLTVSRTVPAVHDIVARQRCWYAHKDNRMFLTATARWRLCTNQALFQRMPRCRRRFHKTDVPPASSSSDNLFIYRWCCLPWAVFALHTQTAPPCLAPLHCPPLLACWVNDYCSDHTGSD